MSRRITIHLAKKVRRSAPGESKKVESRPVQPESKATKTQEGAA